MYEGEVKAFTILNGKGTLVLGHDNSDETLIYDGKFSDDHIKGRGEISSTTGSKLVGIFNDLTLIKGNGKIYFGLLK